MLIFVRPLFIKCGLTELCLTRVSDIPFSLSWPRNPDVAGVTIYITFSPGEILTFQIKILHKLQPSFKSSLVISSKQNSLPGKF